MKRCISNLLRIFFVFGGRLLENFIGSGSGIFLNLFVVLILIFVRVLFMLR